MKSTLTALVAALTMTSLGLAVSTANACGKGGYSGGYGGGYGYHNTYVKKVYVQPVHVHVDPIFHPQHCFAVVMPGDTWFTLTLREYGKPHLWKKIALFNGLPFHAGLVPGMQLKLPVIHPNGVLIPSSAPAPIGLAAVPPVGLPQGGPVGPVSQANFIPQGAPQFAPQANMIPPAGTNFAAPQGPAPNGPAMSAPMFNGAGNPALAPTNTMSPIGAPNAAPSMLGGNGPLVTNSIGVNSTPSAPVANIRTVAAEAKLPSVAIGSILSLDGQSLGSERGTVRIIVNGLTLPVEVLDWTATSAKIQLPQFELAKSVKAELEVLRADGSVASKSSVELTPATNHLALSN